jgi:hypothetical protein
MIASEHDGAGAARPASCAFDDDDMRHEHNRSLHKVSSLNPSLPWDDTHQYRHMPTTTVMSEVFPMSKRRARQSQRKELVRTMQEYSLFVFHQSIIFFLTTIDPLHILLSFN